MTLKELNVIKKCVEKLGIDEKAGIATKDVLDLSEKVSKYDTQLGTLIRLLTPNDLHDFIVNKLYG